MTPCEKLGYKVGDLFEVTNEGDLKSSGFTLGQTIELDKDNGGVPPIFKGKCNYNFAAGGHEGAYLDLECVKPYVEYKPQPEYPTPPFKVSCGDKPEVRQWLKDMGCVWCSGDDLTSCKLYSKRLLVWVDNQVTLEFDGDMTFMNEEFPEVFLEFTTITTLTIEEVQKETDKNLNPEVKRKLELLQSKIDSMQEDIELLLSEYQ